jgi:hypothetical protein
MKIVLDHVQKKKAAPMNSLFHFLTEGIID